jgi:hypothetical protein
MLPPDDVLNIYVGTDSWREIITAQGRVRATGTFSFISGMASMSLLATWAGLFLWSTATDRGRTLWLGGAAILAGLICAATAVSRSGTFLATGLVLGVVFLSRSRKFLILPLIGLAIFSSMTSSDDQSFDSPTVLTTAVIHRHASSDSIFDRATAMFEQLSMSVQGAPLGAGLGIGQVGGVAVTTGEWRLLVYEGELARIVLETGILGLVGTALLRLGVVLALFSVRSRLPTGAGRDSALTCALAVLLFLAGNTAFDHVASGFVWPLIALSFTWCDQQLSRQKKTLPTAALILTPAR